MAHNELANADTDASRESGNSTYLSIDAFLQKTGTALTNAQLPAIAPLLAARGYTADDLKAAQKEADTLRSLNEQQVAEYGGQYDATQAYNAARAALHEDYMDHLKLARIALKADPSAQTALGLRGDRARSQSGYAGQGLLFYNNALKSTAYQAALKKKGISTGDLQAGRQAFAHLQTMTDAQQKETGEAQAEWMSELYETAKVALRKHRSWWSSWALSRLSRVCHNWSHDIRMASEVPIRIRRFSCFSCVNFESMTTVESGKMCQTLTITKIKNPVNQ